MLSRIDLRGRTLGTAELRRTLPRGAADVDSVVDTVRPVVEAIREHGAFAALDYGEEFDRVRPTSVRVPAEVITEA
ncbi:MAG: histidinol dehydrogenase, partial [Dietzia cercidiphylli]